MWIGGRAAFFFFARASPGAARQNSANSTVAMATARAPRTCRPWGISHSFSSPNRLGPYPGLQACAGLATTVTPELLAVTGLRGTRESPRLLRAAPRAVNRAGHAGLERVAADAGVVRLIVVVEIGRASCRERVYRPACTVS